MHWWVTTNGCKVCKGRRQFVEWDSRMMPMWQKTLIIWIVLNIPCLRMGIVKKGSSLLRFFSLSRDFLTESMYHDVLIIQLCYLQNLHSHWFLHQSRKTLFYLAQDDSNITFCHWIMPVGIGSICHILAWSLPTFTWFLHLGKLCFMSPEDDWNITFCNWIISVGSYHTLK